MQVSGTALSRRKFFARGLAVTGALATGMLPTRSLLAAGAPAQHDRSPRGVRPELFRAAIEALSQHGSAIAHHDRIAIADYAAPSSRPRFHLVDMASGATTTMLVAHGSGSDPAHTGWLQRFSNQPGSNASSEGAFVTSDYYTGKHGRSQRLIGLEPSNDNALDRAIVIHSAWYAEKDMIATHGQLGRSQGCFAVGTGDLDELFAKLGPDRLLFSAKV